MINSQNTLSLGLVLLAIFSRLIPHPPNFTPFMAIAIFSGFQLQSKRISLLIPFIALFLSDLILGFYPSMWAVYLSIALISCLSVFLKRQKALTSIGLTTIFGSFLFFVLTNFAVWIQTTAYSKNWQGLSQCYMMALPFFRNSILGDVFYTTTLFLLYEVVQKLSSNANAYPRS